MRFGHFACAAFVLAAIPCCEGEQPILWQAPGRITMNDWIWGAGGEAKAPKPPFEFIEEEFRGTSPKIRVCDAKGDRWAVKFGGENHGDVFASRLLYALGYVAQPTYFVARGTISGVHDLKRAKPFVGNDGPFRFARFKLHESKKVDKVEGLEWAWIDNPFVNTQELNGLKILMMLTSIGTQRILATGKAVTPGFTRTRNPMATTFITPSTTGAPRWGSGEASLTVTSGTRRATKRRRRTSYALRWMAGLFGDTEANMIPTSGKGFRWTMFDGC